MVWIKGLHIISIVFWSASLIYLPVLMAGHNPRVSDRAYVRLHGMVRNIYLRVASPSAIAAIVTGTALIPMREVTAPWFAAKLLLVAVLVAIHGRCGVVLAKQSHQAERASIGARLGRIVAPIVLFPFVLWLVLAKPTWSTSAEPALDTWLEPLRRMLPALERVLPLHIENVGVDPQVNAKVLHDKAVMLPSRPHVLQTPTFRLASQRPTRAAILKATNLIPTDKWHRHDRAGA